MKELIEKVERLIVEAETDSARRYEIEITDGFGTRTMVGDFDKRKIEITPAVTALASGYDLPMEKLELIAKHLARKHSGNVTQDELTGILRKLRLGKEYNKELEFSVANGAVTLSTGGSLGYDVVQLASVRYASLELNLEGN